MVVVGEVEVDGVESIAELWMGEAVATCGRDVRNESVHTDGGEVMEGTFTVVGNELLSVRSSSDEEEGRG